MSRVKLRTFALLLGALFYVLLPTDVLPDFMPLVGWLDDLLVGGLAAYTAWKHLRRPKLPPSQP